MRILSDPFNCELFSRRETVAAQGANDWCKRTGEPPHDRAGHANRLVDFVVVPPALNGETSRPLAAAIIARYRPRKRSQSADRRR